MPRPRTTSDAAVLQAAARTIRRHGPAATTLAAVAAEAGLSPATLVQRFGSKRGLLLALAGTAAASTRNCFEEARRRHESPLAALQAVLAALVEGLDGPAELANDLAFLQLDLRDDEFRTHAVTHARCTEAGIASLLRAAVEAAELREDVDVDRLAGAVHTAYNGALVLWPLTGEGSLPDALRAAVDAVLSPHRSTEE